MAERVRSLSSIGVLVLLGSVTLNPVVVILSLALGIGANTAIFSYLDTAWLPASCRISYDFWQSEYGRRNVLGHSISLDGYPFEIIGVVQHGFFGVDVGTAVNVYAPVCSERFVRAEQSQLDDRMAYWPRVIGRLKPG